MNERGMGKAFEYGEGAKTTDEVLLEKLAKRNETLARENKKLGIDALTDLPGRKLFDQELAKAVKVETYAGEKRRSHEETPSTLAFFDLKEFKLVNDTYGHIPGDTVLRGVAHYLKSILRENDFLARVGGDEFEAIVRDITPENFLRKLQTIRDGAGSERPASNAILGVEVEIPLLNGQTKKIWVEINVGLSKIERGKPVEEITAAADAAMYEGKRNHETGGIATEKRNFVEEENEEG
jgi:diguanylate cyclase (GGDEF)-like protein